jgi:hypothetical protein
MFEPIAVLFPGPLGDVLVQALGLGVSVAIVAFIVMIVMVVRGSRPMGVVERVVFWHNPYRGPHHPFLWLLIVVLLFFVAFVCAALRDAVAGR